MNIRPIPCTYGGLAGKPERKPAKDRPHSSRRTAPIDRRTSSGLLGRDDPDPVIVTNAGANSPFLIVCDHAGAATPRGVVRLGLAESVFATHIAVDIGVGDLGRRLGEALGACVIAQAYSRLLIDCNRAPHHPQSIVEISDGVDIPGNRNLPPDEAGRRLDAVFAPYHARIAAELDARLPRDHRPILVCLHSFTPVLGGEARPWHIGLLHRGDSPISRALLRILDEIPGLIVGDNQPYAMDEVDYTAPAHALSQGLDYLEIEVRQDLIADDAGQARFTDLLAGSLPIALARVGGAERVV